MPEAIPPFAQNAAQEALRAILDKVENAADGSITISGTIEKDVAVMTKDGKSRKVLESDVDKIAVLANIIKSAGLPERWQNMTDKRQRGAEKLLEEARRSEAFKRLTRSERKTINEAYRALKFRGVLSWAPRFSDFIQQVWVDFETLIHSTEVPSEDRAKIEEVLRETIEPQQRPAEKAQIPALFRALARAEQLKSSANNTFGIRTPSKEITDFAHMVVSKADATLVALRNDLTRIQQDTKPLPEKVGEFKAWFLKNITAEQDDALRAMAQNPDYKEFCAKASSEIAHAFEGFQDLINDPPAKYDNAIEKHVAITTRLNALVSLQDTTDSLTETKIPSLRFWLTSRGVTDENDPRHLFLDELNKLFTSLLQKSSSWLYGHYDLKQFTNRQEDETPKGNQDKGKPRSIKGGSPFDVIKPE